MTAPALTRFIQGVSSVGADQLNTFEQTCDTISELRSFVGVTGIQVFVRGGAAIADGQQGVFYWNASATGPDNGTSVIVPIGSSSGAWIRLTFAPPYVTPQMFGAYGDLVHDDTGAINMAVATGLPVIFEVASPTGGFLTDGGHHITMSGQSLIGSALIRKKVTTIQSVFYVDDFVDNVTFNLRIDGNRAQIGTGAGKAVRGIHAQRASNLRIYGEYFNAPDDGLHIWNCPDLYVDPSCYIHDNFNIGTEIKSYTYKPGSPATPWSGGNPLYCTGRVYGRYERNNDAGAGNGTGVDFSEVNNGPQTAFTDGAITSGTADFTTTTTTYTSAVEKSIIKIAGAGAAAADFYAIVKTFVGPHALTLDRNASTTVGPTAAGYTQPATIPIHDLTVGGSYQDNVRAIWTENNDFGGEAYNIVWDSPTITNNVAGAAAQISYYGIGIIGAKNSVLVAPTGRNIANADTGGVNTAFISLSASAGVTQNDTIVITSPVLLEDSGLSDRVEYGIHIEVSTNIQVLGDKMSGYRTAEFSLTSTVSSFWRFNQTSYGADALIALFPPARCSPGMRSFATDANSSTFHAALASGGANEVPVFVDGSGTPAWKIG